MSCLPAAEVPALDVSCLRIHKFTKRKTAHLLSLLSAVLPLSSFAAPTNYVWDGNAPFGFGSSRWSRAVNWGGNGAPPANVVSGLTNTDLTFAGTLKTAPIMNNAYFVRSLTFGPTAGAFTLSSSGSQVLTLGAGGIANLSSSAQRITSSLSLSNSQTWNAANGSLFIQGGLNLAGNLLTLTGPFGLGMTNVIQGAGALLKQGTGNLVLGGASPNTFSGGVTVNSGTVTATKVNALGAGPLTLNGGVLDIGAFNQTVGAVTIYGGTVVQTTGILIGSSYTLQAGVINTRLGGVAPLVKNGSGVMTLTGANTYSGGTVINGGVLAVNNLTGSGTGSGNVAVNSGGTLLGSGFLSGLVVNNAGATISAGAGVGQLTTGGQTWLGGSTFRWELRDATSTAGVGWDLLSINGALNVTASPSVKAYLDIVSFNLGGTPGAAANFNPAQGYSWTIVSTTGGITFAPGQSEATVFDLLTGSFANSLNGGLFSLVRGNNGNDLILNYTPVTIVPEPSKLSFAALCACGYVYVRRFKQNWRGRDSVSADRQS